MKKILLVAVLTLFTFALKAQQYHNGHEYVDLGLSVKWATCNIGATSPEDYGAYFAWGEISIKSSYNTTKYTATPEILPLSNDAANANWGGNWRMPTRTEIEELMLNCTWDWAILNGVKGPKVTSKINGNSIFIPAAGFRVGDNLNNAGSLGNYWSSSSKMNDNYNTYGLSFNSSNVGWGINGRYIGLSVRAVCE